MSRILILGSGGREHALIWALDREKAGHELFCTPGNAGTAQLATNLDGDLADHAAILALAREHQIDLTIVGPEAPLAAGLVDYFEAAGETIFGPGQAAARLESSKIFARDLMATVGIPQPGYTACSSLADAREAAQARGLPVVLKADGLAAGKGVIIARTTAEVEAALQQFFVESAFGKAGQVVSVEECLVGTEMSVFAICDGQQCTILGSAQDYKRAYDGDAGPNTGGMGSLAPSPLATTELLQQVKIDILQPIIAALAADGNPYVGFLYAGLMIVAGEPYVIEFNVRLGDPETQAVLPLLEVPLSGLITAALAGELPAAIELEPGCTVCVVLAAKGYPGKYAQGLALQGLDDLQGVTLFHAGTTALDGSILSTGGRILSLVATAGKYEQARKQVYQALRGLDTAGMTFRTDIGSAVTATEPAPRRVGELSHGR